MIHNVGTRRIWTALAAAAVWLTFAQSVSAQAVNVHLTVRGEKALLNGNQTIAFGSWARFDLAFGHGRSQLVVGGKQNPRSRSTTSFSDDEPELRSPELTAAVAIAVIERTDGGYRARIAVSVGREESGNWTFVQQEDTAVVTADEPFEFEIVHSNAGLKYKAALRIEAYGDPARPRGPCQGELTPRAEFRIAYSLDDLAPSANPLAHDEAAAARLPESGDRVVDFAKVVDLGRQDSCYHYVKVTLKDLEYAGCQKAVGTLLVERRTVFGSDSPLHAQRFSARRIFEDNFETEIRLANGKPLDVVIPRDQNSQFPFPASETYRITGDW